MVVEQHLDLSAFETKRIGVCLGRLHNVLVLLLFAFLKALLSKQGS